MKIRDLNPGMGMAVASRTVLRKGETWGDVARRVAYGNSDLLKKFTDDPNVIEEERDALYAHIANGSILMSGRHLQHGDSSQPDRNQEVYTNCATAINSTNKFYLLLNGSGVGRVYDDDVMAVDWDLSPNIRCVLSDAHADYNPAWVESVNEGVRKYPHSQWHTVEDSREGWARAFELWESMTFEGIHKDRLLVFDFSQVRPSGSPIGGMQDRPASGPLPLIRAFELISSVKGLNWPMWLQAMWVDHYLADCVLVGGVRRSARIAGKWWRDKDIIDFIHIKRPNELMEKYTISEIREARKAWRLSNFLHTANNSVIVDDEFWALVQDRNGTTPDHYLARRVFEEVCRCSYADGTGEPGFVTVTNLSCDETGLYEMMDTNWFGSSKFMPKYSKRLLQDLTEKVRWKKHKFFVNP